MRGNKGKKFIIGGLLVAGLLTFGGFHGLRTAWSPVEYLTNGDIDHEDGKYATILDERGNVIDEMARTIHVGDEIIAGDNKTYRIVRVSGNKAYGKFIGVDGRILTWARSIAEAVPAAKAGAARKSTIAVYHTHSDESYVPSDGKANIPARGGIYQVGSTMVLSMRKLGLDVAYDRTPHDPHDANAYLRSRKTAVQLLKDKPQAIFDVHRDGVPDSEFYERQVSGAKVTQIRLVVGRQNPNRAANLDFARKLKAYEDRVHPGLIKSIFLAQGDYNQDLSPTALLLEIGTHTNNKADAEKGAALFADAIPQVVGQGVTPPGQKRLGSPQATSTTSRTPGAWWALFGIVTVTAIGGGAFLLLNTGSIEGLSKMLSKFRQQEVGKLLFGGRNQRGHLTLAKGQKPLVSVKEVRKNLDDEEPGDNQ